MSLYWPEPAREKTLSKNVFSISGSFYLWMPYTPTNSLCLHNEKINNRQTLVHASQEGCVTRSLHVLNNSQMILEKPGLAPRVLRCVPPTLAWWSVLPLDAQLPI